MIDPASGEVAADGTLTISQNTETATVVAKKCPRVWTGVKDEEAISRGIYDTKGNDFPTDRPDVNPAPTAPR